MTPNSPKQIWEDWAREDPLWAILSAPEKDHGRWDIKEFFSTGQVEIRGVMTDLSTREVNLSRRRCLDFGCGVGRLTQALAEFFDRCDGVDISDTMVRQANEFNQHGDQCAYHVNDVPNLNIFDDESFDFIYSNIVLQHIEPELSEKYVREFVRVLAVGGVALFQVPSAYTPPHPEAPPEAPPEPVPGDAHIATLGLVSERADFLARHQSELRVRVRNDSNARWPPVPSLRLGNHWRSADGSEVLLLDDARSSLPHAVEPGGEVVMSLIVNAPATPGSYVLELDMVEEEVCWFADRGSPTLRIRVRVRRATRAPQLSRALRKLRTRSVPIQTDEDTPTPETRPRPYGMYALPRTAVVAAVEESGGSFLAIEEYNPSGPGWESYRYYVTK